MALLETLKLIRLAEIDVDAKYKQGAGAAWMRLTWMLRGCALIERGAVLRRYDWEWDIPETCQDPDAELFAASLWTLLPTFAQTIDALQPWTPVVLDRDPNDAWQLTIDREDDGTITLRLRIEEDPNAKKPRPAMALALSGRPARYPSIFVPNHPGMSYAERLDSPESVEILNTIFNRLNMNKQAQRRAGGTPYVFIVLWPVPPGMEVEFDREALRNVWQRLSDENGWPPAAVWPRGAFEVKGQAWIPNAAAAPLLA